MLRLIIITTYGTIFGKVETAEAARKLIVTLAEQYGGWDQMRMARAFFDGQRIVGNPTVGDYHVASPFDAIQNANAA